MDEDINEVFNGRILESNFVLMSLLRIDDFKNKCNEA